MAWWLVGTTAFMGRVQRVDIHRRPGLADDHCSWSCNFLGQYAECIWWRLALRAVVSPARVITVMDSVAQRFGAGNEQFVHLLQLHARSSSPASGSTARDFSLPGISTRSARCASRLRRVVIVCCQRWVGHGRWRREISCRPCCSSDHAARRLVRAGTRGWRPIARPHLPPSHSIFPRALSPATARSGDGSRHRQIVSVQPAHLRRTFLYVSTAPARGRPVCSPRACSRSGRYLFIPPLARAEPSARSARAFSWLSSPGEAAPTPSWPSTRGPLACWAVVTAIIAATLTGMDDGLNKNAASFRSVYVPLIRPRATSGASAVGRIATVLTGCLVILLALKYSRGGTSAC